MINSIFIIFLAITVLFFLLLIIKSVTKCNFCVLCGSISLTWIVLLFLRWGEIFNNPLLLALLIGNSVVGIYYMAEKRVAEKFQILRLPFFLTLLLIGYILASGNLKEVLSVIVFLAILWIIFTVFYFYRNNPKVGHFFKKIIECCKNW